MGAHICSSRRSIEEHEEQELDEFSNVSHSSLAELLSSESPSNERKNKRARSSTYSSDQVVGKVRKLTLEEWLIASPARSKKDNMTVGSGELYVFRNFTRRVFPASPMLRHAESTDLDSGIGGKSPMDIDISCENGNHIPAIGKAKKRVSFKLPQEADIIIIYSPVRELQGTQAIPS
ncbi:hypothetical protein QQ045_006572 [Rhodiola kirilowii]